MTGGLFLQPKVSDPDAIEPTIWLDPTSRTLTGFRLLYP